MTALASTVSRTRPRTLAPPPSGARTALRRNERGERRRSAPPSVPGRQAIQSRCVQSQVRPHGCVCDSVCERAPVNARACVRGSERACAHTLWHSAGAMDACSIPSGISSKCMLVPPPAEPRTPYAVEPKAAVSALADVVPPRGCSSCHVGSASVVGTRIAHSALQRWSAPWKCRSIAAWL